MNLGRIAIGLSLSVVFLSSSISQAVPEPIPLRTDIVEFTNENCERTQSCDLKKVSFRKEDYKIWIIDRYHYGTETYSKFETERPDQLENYAFVQFMRGCQFETEKMPGNRIEKRIVMAVESFDQVLRFKFPTWIIDSVDVDPVYNSSLISEYGTRHHMYRWNRTPNSFKKDTEEYFGLRRPENASHLYVKDLPGSAFKSDDNKRYQNISLEFKTCLYKTRDIPEVSTRNAVELGVDPLFCYEWMSTPTYNFTSRAWEFTDRIDPFCLQTERIF